MGNFEIKLSSVLMLSTMESILSLFFTVSVMMDVSSFLYHLMLDTKFINVGFFAYLNLWRLLCLNNISNMETPDM